MSKRLLLLNLILVSAGVVFSILLAQTFLSAPRPQSAATESLGPRAGTPPGTGRSTDERARVLAPLATYDVVASKNLFNPSRAETGTASVSPAGKPFLHGVVLRDGAPIAVLEDPTTKKVSLYKLGDPVAGGELERIEADRVVIRRGEETFEVLLRDPSKPKVAVVPATPPGQPRATPVRPQPGAPAVQPSPPVPAPPGTAPPTLFRRPQAPATPPVRNAPGS